MIPKVAFSSDIFETQRYGGISRYFVSLAEELDKLNMAEVDVPLLFHINHYLKKSKVSRRVYVPFSPSRVRIDSIIARLNSQYSQRVSRNKSYDIRHETFYRGRVGDIRAKYTVTTVYDLIREKFEPNWSGGPRKAESLERSDVVIAISRTTADDLINFYRVDPLAIKVIHLGVNEEFFENDFQVLEFRKRQQLLYVGGREGYKGFLTLVRAFYESNYLKENFHVLVFGPVFSEKEKTLMRDLRVFHLFHQKNGPDSALVNAYRESLALIVTSQYEGFGLPALEAMASGCLVLSTGKGALEEIGNGKYVRFEHGSTDSLIYEIESIAQDEKRAQQLRSDARVHSEHFRWRHTALNTLRVYKELIQ